MSVDALVVVRVKYALVDVSCNVDALMAMIGDDDDGGER